MLSYLLTASLLLLVFALGYYIFLRQSPALPLRRRVLLLGLFGILLLPLCPSPPTSLVIPEAQNPVVQVEAWQTTQATPDIPETASITVCAGETIEDSINDVIVSHNTIWDNPASQLLLIYGIGVLVLLARMIIGLLRLVKLHRSSYSSGDEGVRILRGGGDAFTFGTTVYLSQSVYDSYDAEVILTHERAHAQQWHTFDALLAEMTRAIFWFHPMVWWLREQVQLNLEYLADAAVLAQGYDKRDYQLSLVAHQQGVDFRTSLLPQFAAKGLKRRIQMMGFRAGSQVRSLVVTGGLIFFAFLAFAVTNGKAQSVVDASHDPELRKPLNTDLGSLYDGEAREYSVYFKRLPTPTELAGLRQGLKYFYNRDFYVYQDCLDPEGTFTFAFGVPNKTLHEVKFSPGERTELPQLFQVTKDGYANISDALFRPQPLPVGAPDGDIVFNQDGEWISISLNPGRPFTADDLTAAPRSAQLHCQLGLTPENKEEYNIHQSSLMVSLLPLPPEELLELVFDQKYYLELPRKYFFDKAELSEEEFLSKLIQKGLILNAAVRTGGPSELAVFRLDTLIVLKD